MTAIGLLIGHQVRYFEGLETPFARNVPVLPLWFLLPIGAAWLLSFRLFGLYERANLVSGIGEYRRISTAGLVTTLAVIVFSYIRVNPYIARGFLLLSLLFVVVLVGFVRFWIRRYVYSQARRGHPLDRLVIVGSSRNAISVARQLIDSPSSSADVVGFLSEYMPRGTILMGGLRVLGEPMELQRIAETYGITRALVVESGLSWESLQALVRLMHRRDGVDISLIPGMFDLHATQMEARQIGPVLALVPRPARIVGADAAIKRILDLTVGMTAALVSLPLAGTIIAASLIRRSGTGVATRTYACGGRPLKLLEFRSDWARRHHLSRLPQLLRVLEGSLSLVGPRPNSVDQLDTDSPWLGYLEAAKPGFIGPWWLVGRGRPTLPDEELAYDLHYLRHYSIWFDLHILVQVSRCLLGATSSTERFRSPVRPETRIDHPVPRTGG